jgi:Tfp pilus assembly protein PilV
MYKKLKTPTQFCGFLLIELMVALAAVLLSMSILVGWHNLIIKKQTDALRQLHVVTSTTSLLEQLKIDRTLRNKQRMQKDGITYSWQTKSTSLDMINSIIGNADVPTYFSFITVLASWKTYNGQEKTYSLCAGVHE